MTAELLIFYVLAASALVSALLVVSMKNLARALFLLFVTLFSVAGLFIFCLADFIALTQIMVYVGGVLVLMLFAFMLSNKELLNDLQKGLTGFFALPRWQALIITAGMGFILIHMAINMGSNLPKWVTEAAREGKIFTPTDHTEKHIGLQLMTRYLLPFELISLVLLMALMGAAHLTRKEPKP
ncbi:NADH dehydrogenase subunit J [bacterium A37T11]|nr:NADH dehydrogenase subunit J [bacterium A37T11]